jgi:hypothetical protein
MSLFSSIGSALSNVWSGAKSLWSGLTGSPQSTVGPLTRADTFLTDLGQGLGSAFNLSSGPAGVAGEVLKSFGQLQSQPSYLTNSIKPGLLNNATAYNNIHDMSLGQALGAGLGGYANYKLLSQQDQQADTINPTQQGLDQRAYLNAAYPELSPWELAGANSAQGQIGSAAISAQVQDRLQKRQLKVQTLLKAMELENAQKIARLQVAGNLEMNRRSVGVESRRVDLQEARFPTEMLKLTAEIQHLDADARNKVASYLYTLQQASRSGSRVASAEIMDLQRELASDRSIPQGIMDNLRSVTDILLGTLQSVAGPVGGAAVFGVTK